MEKKIIYKAIIFVLVLLNIGSVSFMYLNRKHHPPHPKETEGPKMYIIEQLDLDKEQQKTYEGYIKQHQITIRKLQDNKVKLKKELYKHLNEDSKNGEQIDSLIDSITEVNRKIEQTHYHHFEEIRSICKDDNQLEKYEQLSKEFSRFFASPLKKK